MDAGNRRQNIKLEPVVDHATVGLQGCLDPSQPSSARAPMPESTPGSSLMQPVQPPAAEITPDADAATPGKLHELLMQLTSTTSATAAMLAQQQQQLLAQQQLQQQQVMALLSRTRSQNRDASTHQHGIHATAAAIAAASSPQESAPTLAGTQSGAQLTPFLSVTTERPDSTSPGSGSDHTQISQHPVHGHQPMAATPQTLALSKSAAGAQFSATEQQAIAAVDVGSQPGTSKWPNSNPGQLDSATLNGGLHASPSSQEEACGALHARPSMQSTHGHCQAQPQGLLHQAHHNSTLPPQTDDDLLGSLWHSSQHLGINMALESMPSVSSQDMAAAAAVASRPALQLRNSLVTELQHRPSAQQMLAAAHAEGSSKPNDAALAGWLSRQPSSVLQQQQQQTQQQQVQHKRPPTLMAMEEQAVKETSVQGSFARLNSGMWAASQGHAQQTCSNGPSMSMSGGGASTPTVGAPATSSGAGGQLSYPAAEASNAAVMADRELFMNTLKRLHEALGTRFRIPVVGGQELDLWLLYRQVVAYDGLAAVISHKKWADVCQPFNFPATFTSRSFTMRKTYSQILWHYEQVYMHGNTGPLLPPPAPDQLLGNSTPHHQQQQQHQNQNQHNHNHHHQHGVQSLGVQYVQANKRQRTLHERHSSGLDNALTLPTPHAPTSTAPVGHGSPWEGPMPANQGLLPQQISASIVASAPALSAMRVDSVGMSGLENIGVGTTGHFVVTQRVDHGFFVDLQLGGARFRGMLYCPPDIPMALPTPAPPATTNNTTRSAASTGLSPLHGSLSAAPVGASARTSTGLSRQVTWPHSSHMAAQPQLAHAVPAPSDLLQMPSSCVGVAPQHYLPLHGVSPDMAEAASHLLNMDQFGEDRSLMCL